MKKKYHYSIAFVLFCLVFMTACGKSKPKKEKEDTKISIDSSADTDFRYNDTLKLVQGDIPKGWEKVTLWDKGYYVAFPKKPWKQILRDKKRIDYRYPKKNYDIYAAITDLSQEPAFKDNKTHRQIFYDAIVKDLLADLTDSDETNEVPHIVKREDFLSLNIYDAMRIELEATDVHVYLECVVMGKMLYTLSFMIWGEETLAILQLKDQFFYSFGKELNVE